MELHENVGWSEVSFYSASKEKSVNHMTVSSPLQRDLDLIIFAPQTDFSFRYIK